MAGIRRAYNYRQLPHVYGIIHILGRSVRLSAYGRTLSRFCRRRAYKILLIINALAGRLLRMLVGRYAAAAKTRQFYVNNKDDKCRTRTPQGVMTAMAFLPRLILSIFQTRIGLQIRRIDADFQFRLLLVRLFRSSSPRP